MVLQPKLRYVGVLRFLLAITVVFAHSYGYVFVGGKTAVQLFYLVSGYLISFVLQTRIGYKTQIGNFYLNRFLRLYPIYFVVAVLSLAGNLFVPSINLNSELIETFKNTPSAGIALLVVSNLSLLFQDWTIFLGIHSGQIGITQNLTFIDTRLYHGLLVPQAWSISLEIYFYLLAPFLIRKNSRILLFFLISLSIRIALLLNGIGFSDPWNYRFFPAELSLFLLGVMAQKFLGPLYKCHLTGERFDKLSGLATSFVAILLLFFWKIPKHESYYLETGLFIIVIICLPFLFNFSKLYSFDRHLGELSYPIYMVHILIIRYVDIVFTTFGYTQKRIAILSLSIVISELILRIISNPIERIRDRFKS